MRGVGKFQQATMVLLGVGGNVVGPWGNPRATLTRACRELDSAGVKIVRASNYYCTRPVGDTPQPRYINAVLLAKAYIAPGALLRLLKQIERRAGRRTGRAMTSRPLDLDILDFGGRRIGKPARRRERGRLILPHPEMHKRAFVLVCTDLLDENAARPLLRALPMLARRHSVTVVTATDADIVALATGDPTGQGDAFRAAAAASVLAAFDRARALIGRAGADVVESPAETLPAACVSAYLRAKARQRL